MTVGAVSRLKEFRTVPGTLLACVIAYSVVLGVYLFERARWRREGYVTVKTDGRTFAVLYNERAVVLLTGKSFDQLRLDEGDWLTVAGFEDVIHITRLHGAYHVLRRLAAL